MKRPGNTTIAVGAGVLAAAALVAVIARPGSTSWWTDGAAIRVAAEGAPLREILWKPAVPLKGGDPVGGGDLGGAATADEYEPRYSADGTMVVFVRNRPGANADLYTARWTPAGWGAPEPVAAINTEKDELGPELARDGSALYFYSDRAGGLGGYDLWVSRKDEGGWGAPTNLGPTVNSRFNEYGPALTPEGGRLYFSSNRPRDGEVVTSGEAWTATVREQRTRHDYDLYSAGMGEGSAGEEAAPVVALNTGADEGAPAISPAGDFLYFASDRAGGWGGFDVYRTRLSGLGRGGAGESGIAGTIENLGESINSGFNDLDPALSSDGFRLTFSSDRPVEAAAVGAAAASAGEGANAQVAPHDGRYTLWTSVSREVYREVQRQESRVWAGWGKLWPWLLLLLLALVPLVLFYRLLRDARWRTRFARLSLLAQCLLLSLIVHAGIASALTVWKVGSGVIDLIAKEGGGTRVILSSGAASGAIYSQVRGGSTEAPAALPSVEPYVVAPIGGAVESVPLMAALPDLSVGETLPPVMIPSNAVMERGHSGAARSSIAAADLPREARDLASAVPQSSERVAVAAEAVPTGVVADLGTAKTPAVEIGSAAQEVSRLDLPARAITGDNVPPPVVAPSNRDPGRTSLTNATATRADSLPQATSDAGTVAAVPGSERAAVTTEAAGPSTVVADAGTGQKAPAVTLGAASGSVAQVDLPAREVTGTGLMPPVIAPMASAEFVGTGGGKRVTSVPARATESGLVASLPQVRQQHAAKAEATRGVGDAALAGEGVSRAPAPLVNGGVSSAAFDAALPKLQSEGRGAGASALTDSRLTGTSDTNTGAVASIRPLAAPGNGAANNSRAGLDSAVPALARTAAKSGQEPSTTPHSGPDVGFAPAPVGIATGTVGTPAAVVVNPGQRSAAGSAMGPMAAPVATTRRDPGSVAGSSKSRISELAATGREDVIPVGIPVPVETFAQRAPESRADLVKRMGGSAETERAVGLALEWMQRHQAAAGYWSAEHFDDRCTQCSGAAEVKADTAMTGLALLCYLGAGHTHQQEGPYRDAVSRGIAWLVKRQASDGDLRRGETMYGQTVAAVALCEAYAMTRDAALAEPARRAVEFVLVRANKAGRGDDRDTSVIGWLVFTVESARRAGFEVPTTTFDGARQWLAHVQDPAAPGRYAYTKGGPASAAMTAEAMFVQQLLGHTREERMMEQSARFVLGSPPVWREGASTYSWYYATLALFQHQGEAWKQWNEQIVKELLANQRKEGASAGSWDTTDEWSRLGGRVYQTAICTLSLEVYYRYKAE